MKKLLRTSDILYLGLAGALEIFEELKDPFGIMAWQCKGVYGFVPSRYKRRNFTRMVRRALKTGNIEKVVSKGEIYLRLTSQGEDRVKRDFQFLSLQRRKWDKRWRVVIFDIEEIARGVRDILRLKLRELGFGMFQYSVWITPYDISLDFREFISSKGLGDKVYIMEVSRFFAGSEKELARKIWQLDDLNEEYQTLLDKLEALEKESTTKDNGRYKKLVHIQKEFLGISMKDPFLPHALLPEDWLREKTAKKLKEFSKKLPNPEMRK